MNIAAQMKTLQRERSKTKRSRANGEAQRRAGNRLLRDAYTRTREGAPGTRTSVNGAPCHGKGNSSKAFKLKPGRKVK